MPTPLPAPTLVALAVPATYLAMVAIERLDKGWRWPARRGWQWTGLQFFLLLGTVNALVSTALGLAFPRLHLVDGAALGVAAGTAVGYLVLSLGNALLHASYHRVDFLWRHVHQLHHAPARLDVAGVMYQAPWEMLANAVLFFGVTRLLLGLDPLATMLCAYLGAFYGMFQHFNLRTPRWLGWFIQRPEAHCEHHRRGVHAGNYSDLPWWDMLAGTYSNPARFEGELGFAPDAATRVGDMLRGIDVNAGRPVAGAAPAAMPLAEARAATASRPAPLPRQRHAFPVLRWLALAWLVVFVPAWYAAYGAWHFLFLCNLGVLLTCAGLVFAKPLLLSSQAIAAPGIAGLWLLDAGWRLASGTHLHGGTAYMWDDSIPALVRAMSLYHLAWPVLLAWCLHRGGYDRRGLALQLAIAAAVFVVGLTLAPASENLNYVVAAPGASPAQAQPALRALANYAILAGAIYLPTHWLLRRVFASPRATL